MLEAKEGLGGPSNIVAHCKISNQPLNDRNILAHFCPHVIATDDAKNIASTIFAKMRKESDQSFLSKGSMSIPTHIVGKKWEPRNPVPGPFSAKIRKVNQNSKSRRESGK